MSCTVCCDPYTKETRKMISCFSCAYEACCRCVKTFLTSTPTEPACMNCRHPWSREFLDAHMSRSWLEGDLKLHRQKILFDRERALLPATQPDVEIELQKRAYAANRPLLLERVKTALGDELALLNKQIQDEYNYILSGPAIAAKRLSTTIAACPSTSCRGFLSTAYKCGTCATQFCSDCREIRSEAAGHVCDPALVATIAAIVADSRPCPRCSTAISKISGCDQMYCTQCDTPFSYENGTIVKGIIHNPHYFERLQKLKATGPGQGCNGWPTLSEATLANNMLIGFLQTAVNVENVDLADLLTVVDNRDLRVKYLLNELDEKKFKQLIQQRDRKLKRDLEIRAVLELFVITTMEYFHGSYITTDANIKAFQLQIATTINAPLKAIGERYANRIPQFEIDTGRIIYV